MQLSVVKINQSLDDRIEIIDEKGNLIATMANNEDFKLAELICKRFNE